MAKIGLDKDAVLQIAVEIADEKGLRNVTLKELAEKLKIKTPSLYNHVNGLPDLNNMLAIHGLISLRTEITNAAVGLSGDEAIRSISQAYINFAITHPGLYEATQWINVWQNEEAEEISSGIIEIVRKVLSDYSLTSDDLTHIVRMFRGLLHGFASLMCNQGFGNPICIDDSIDKSIAVMLAGIKAIYSM